MKQVYIMVGYPGAGKTSWASKQEGVLRIDGDSLKTPKRMMAAATAAARIGEQDILFDSTGCTKERRAQFIAFAKQYGYTPTIVWIQTPIDVAMAQNAQRTKPVPPIALYTYRKRFEEPTCEETVSILSIQTDSN